MSLRAHGSLGQIQGTAHLTVIPADSVEVEDSPTLKYLRLRTGDYSCYKRIFLVVDRERCEITVDELPEDG